MTYLFTFLFSFHLAVVIISLVYHRDYTHGSIKLNYKLACLLRFWAWLSMPRMNEVGWVATHYQHHGRSDEETDPHSPRHNKWWRLLFDFEGVVTKKMSKRRPAMKIALTRVPNDSFRWLFSLNPVAPFVALTWLLAPICGLWSPLYVLTIWMASRTAAFVFTVGTHFKFLGARKFDLDDDSVNIHWLWLIGAGEEYHNNHHRHPKRACLAEEGQFDLGFWYCKQLARFGLCEFK